MTTVGYGDILPTTDSERLYVTGVMFVGATVFGYIVGVVREVASNPNGAAARERVITSTTNHYMIEQKIDLPLRNAVKKQVAFFTGQRSPFDGEALLQLLPKQLLCEAIIQSSSGVIPLIPIFRGQGRRYIAHIVKLMRPHLALPSTEIYRSGDPSTRGIHFITVGLAEMRTRVQSLTHKWSRPASLYAGDFFGHLGLLGGHEPASMARTVLQTQLYYLPEYEWRWLHTCRPALAQKTKKVVEACAQQQDQRRVEGEEPRVSRFKNALKQAVSEEREGGSSPGGASPENRATGGATVAPSG